MAGPGLIAKKIGMTRVVDDKGRLTAVTVLQIEAQKVTKVLNSERDGYNAIQIGYYTKREKLLGKADVARLRKAEIAENFTRFKELRTEKPLEGVSVGTAIGLDVLEGVTSVDVTGITKGRGFQGAQTRWNSARGRMSHGSRFHRRPGSLGNRSTPGRVFKNKHMPGHMGDVQRTIQNLAVVDVDKDRNLLVVQGSVPGHRDGFLVIKPSLKA
jgi:large subunit ribosomal protein L3